MIYSLDPTGMSSDNKILNEVNVVNPPDQISDASFIVPRVTPFFREGLVITHGARILVENVDYQLVFRSVALSEHFERELFGGIMFVTRSFAGTINLTYQVLGGDFQTADTVLLEQVARLTGSIRWITYDQLVGVPSGFPPAYHSHDMEQDIVNMASVVDAVEQIAIQLSLAPRTVGEVSARLMDHLEAPQAHDKSHVGLGNVENIGVATEADITNGTRRYVTADVLQQRLSTFTPPTPTPTPTPTQLPSDYQQTVQQVGVLRTDMLNVATALASNSATDATWRQLHLQFGRDPHPQYVTSSAMANQLSDLIDRLNGLETTVNGQATGDTTALTPIKAFWEFETPWNETTYVFKPRGAGIPSLPRPAGNTDTNYTPIKITNFQITKKQERKKVGDGGNFRTFSYYCLVSVEFTTDFPIELSKIQCRDALGNIREITKTGNTYKIVLPLAERVSDEVIGGLFYEYHYRYYTPLSLSVR